MSHLGTELLKPAVLSLVKVSNATYTATADGIQPIQDVMAVLPSLMALPGIVENREKIIAQALDLDSAEIDDIAAAVETEMGFGSAKAKNVVEKALVALGHNLNLILAIREDEASDEA